MVRNMAFSFPRCRHSFAKMSVKSPQKIKSNPPNSTLSKLRGKVNQKELFPHCSSSTKVNYKKIPICCLLSGTDCSKENRHRAKKGDDWSIVSCYALEMILICQNCQRLLSFEGN